MRILFIATFALVTQVVMGADTNIEQIVKRGIATRDELNTLSTNDVPAKWRTRVDDQSTETYTKKVFSRGNEKVLEVMWKTNWNGSMSNVFAATVYDGPKKIGKVIAFSDGAVNIMQPRNTRNDYDMTTSIKTNGLVRVMFANDSGYLEIIELKGRDTRLVDDMEYTKGAVLIDEVGKPLVDSVKSKPEKAPKEQ